MIAAWFLFPLLLTALALGWGLLLERASGRTLPRSLLPGVGIAAIIVAGTVTTASDATAELTTPIVAVVGVLGLIAGARERFRVPPTLWVLAAPAGVFAVYAAPIVLSGEATFAGYIKLDDTATWLALTDRLMEHGRSLDGLAPSSYEATLAFNLGDWYPLGVFIPLGAGSEILGQDPAWLIQPYMAWLAASLALPFARLAAATTSKLQVRAAIAFVAAQPALLVGYYLWGGIKEVAAATLIAHAAALGAECIEGRPDARSLLPLWVVCAALIAVLTLAAAVWLAPILLGVAALVIRKQGFASVRKPLGWAAALIAAIVGGLVVTGAYLPPTSSSLAGETDLGNLLAPLNPLQAFGIWIVGDFRDVPGLPGITYVAVTVAISAAAYGTWWALRRSPGAALLCGSALIGAAALTLGGSPWVEGKALAIASPALLLLALIGSVRLLDIGRRIEGWTALAVIVAGVFVSNVLAYSDVNLGPRQQLAELEDIGRAISGDGPTLMTEFQPYGVRHFLREADPESVAELRRRTIPLRTGFTVPKGLSADLDELQLESIRPYRTIVLRRSPSHSRPPAPYELISSDEYYEVWQRPEAGGPEVLAHLPLGVADPFPATNARTTRTSVPSCPEILQLGRLAARTGGNLVAAPGDQPIDVGLTDGIAIIPRGRESLSADFEAEGAGSYGVWLGGSVRGKVVARVDGIETGSVNHHLNNSGEFLELGEARLEAGSHRIEVDFSAGPLRPGTGGDPIPAGPLMIGVSAGDRAGSLVSVPPPRAGSLCGTAWDWVEAVRGGASRSGG